MIRGVDSTPSEPLPSTTVRAAAFAVWSLGGTVGLDDWAHHARVTTHDFRASTDLARSRRTSDWRSIAHSRGRSLRRRCSSWPGRGFRRRRQPLGFGSVREAQAQEMGRVEEAASISFDSVRDKNVMQLRKLNTAIFPVTYQDKFYTDALNSGDFTKLGNYSIIRVLFLLRI